MHYSRFALLVPLLAVLSGAPALATTVDINNAPLDLNPAPIMQGGRVFVPMRGIFEALGAGVVYDNGTINATRGETTVSIHIGSTQATISGSEQTIDSPPFIVGDTTYVPLRFVAQALGDDVSYDDSSSTVEISQRSSRPPAYVSEETDQAVTDAPPPLPVYVQPPCPEPNYLWTPGYWGWSNLGYYWVPGTWAPAPAPNLLWTPGYWGRHGGGYAWNAGYWGPHIGFYGGINYGFGYVGSGFIGGGWSGGFFHYNTAVLNIGIALLPHAYFNAQPAPFYGGSIPSTYINNSQHNISTTIINNHTTYISNHNTYITNRYASSDNRASFAGGPQGVAARPNTEEQLAVAERHVPPTPIQQRHIFAAAQNRNYLAAVNHGRPADAAVARPISQPTQVRHFAAIQPQDRSAAAQRRTPSTYTRGAERTTTYPSNNIRATRVRPARQPSERQVVPEQRVRSAAPPRSEEHRSTAPRAEKRRPESYQPETSRPESHRTSRSEPAERRPVTHSERRPATHSERRPATHSERRPATHAERRPAEPPHDSEHKER